MYRADETSSFLFNLLDNNVRIRIRFNPYQQLKA